MPAQTRTTPTTATPAPETSTATAGPATSDPQNTLGNAGVQGQIAAAKAPAVAALPPAAPPWSKGEMMPIQTELARLGLYKMTVDGLFGRGTSAALVEAFGSDEWATMTAKDALARLKTAKTPEGDAAKKQFRFGEMCRDGLLDLTIGVGFDENGSHLAVIEAFTEALGARGFNVDAGTAAKWYAGAGRSVGNSAFGKYFTKAGALTYKPPAGPARSINAVIRFVDNGDGKSGKDAANAFSEGMTESDASYYAGHGRYGSGPDFDQNMTFDLLDAGGKVVQHLDDYEDLEKIMADQGKTAGRDPWKQFSWAIANNRLHVNGTNEGNVFLNTANQHPGEFGGKLMYWNVLRTGGQGAEVQTGVGGGLDKKHQENPQHRYSLMVFNGCRTQDYVKSLRATPGMDAKGADVVASTRTLYWYDMANTMASFVDSVIGQQSAEATVKAMDDKQVTERPAGAAGKAFSNF